MIQANINTVLNFGLLGPSFDNGFENLSSNLASFVCSHGLVSIVKVTHVKVLTFCGRNHFWFFYQVDLETIELFLKIVGRDSFFVVYAQGIQTNIVAVEIGLANFLDHTVAGAECVTGEFGVIVNYHSDINFVKAKNGQGHTTVLSIVYKQSFELVDVFDSVNQFYQIRVGITGSWLADAIVPFG